MEHCWTANGPSLLQRSASTAIIPGGSSPLTESISALSANISLTVNRMGLLRSLVKQLPNFGGQIPSNLPNITDYEANRQELSNALYLNLGVFVFAVFLWGISTCVKAVWQSQSPPAETGTSHGSSNRNVPGSESESPRGELNTHAAVPKRNYLLFLLVCMYTCLALSFVNVCFLLLHGLAGVVLFGGWSILMVLGQVSMAEIYFITFLDGCIVLAFTQLFEHLIELPEKDLAKDQLRCTVWMQGLPTHDTMRWWKPFRINPLEAGRVRHDLMEALTDHLHLPSQSSPDRSLRHALTTSALHKFSPQETDAAGGAAHPVPPPPPPVDLQDTSWRCCLHEGNPYYLNVVTGAVQWDPPCELATMSKDSPVVEEIYVASVLDEWHHANTELQQALEYLAAYEQRLEAARHDFDDEECSTLWRVWLRPALWWYSRKVSLLIPLAEILKDDLERVRSGKKLISGSAFVTFKHPRYRDQLLQEDEDDPVSSWIMARAYTYFSFGRPPFASVTLSCERAPHPSDMNWQNLHIPRWQREITFWVLASLLLFVMVVVVTVVRISEYVVPVIIVVRKELDVLENLPSYNDYVPDMIKQLVTNLHNEQIWRSLLKQVPTVVLLFINSVVVPYTITGIAACERTVKLSDAECTRMLVNFFFLFINTVVVPFCGVASLSELLTMLLTSLQGQESPELFRGLIFASPGVFALKYIMNATFISSANQLLQLPQIVGRWCQVNILAVTERHKRDLQQPWPFHWGYWYAWTLSVFALGVNMSVACPSTLPIAALFFFVKYHVDKYNLDNDVFACGTDVEGGLAVRIVCYLRVVVALWWLAMGALSCAIAMFNPLNNLTPVETVWLRQGGITLMVLGAFTCVCSWWLRHQQLHRLELQPTKKTSKLNDLEPTFWDHLGEALYLTTPATRGGNATDPLEVSHPDAAGGCVKPKKQDLSWDGAKLLGLE